MKNKFGVSRCCCESGGTGVCNDSCLSSFNGCGASSNGSIYTSLADAWSNCGWHNTGQIVTGSNGNFSRVVIGGGANFGIVAKYFSFDYRSSTTIEVSFVSNHNNSTYANSTTGFTLLTGNFVHQSASTNFLNQTQPPTFRAASTITQCTETETVGLVATIGSLISTRNGTYSYFNGTTDVSTTGCIDLIEVGFDYKLAGSTVASETKQIEFAGGRCYVDALINMFNSPLGGTSNSSTSSMTISTT